MVTGAQVERVVRRFDRRLLQLEAEAIGALRTALHQSAAALEEELRRLYRRALEGTSSAGAHIREAHVRQLLAEVRGAQTALALGRDIPVESILTNLQRHATITGAEQALALLTLSEQAIVGLAGGLNVDAILAATRVSSRLTEIGAARVANGTARLLQHTETAARAIEQHVIDGVTRGQGWSVTARNIRKDVALLDYEAERIVRTESITAADEARKTRYMEAGVETLRWLSTADERVCYYCAARSGKLFALEDVVIPAHPNCVIGDTHVLAQGVRGHSKRWYEGPVVTITTRLGNRLTCTPNHPILTRSGWVPAGSLDVGSHVISHLRSQGVTLGGLDDEHVEGRIEEVIDALGESPEMATRPVPVTAEDFHGDGAGSEVAVIGAYRHLWDGADAAFQQHVVQLALLGAVELSLSCYRARRAQLDAGALLTTAHGLVCGHHLPLALLLGHARPLDRLGFTWGAQGHASVHKPPINDLPGDPVLLGEGVGAEPGLVGGHEFLDGQHVNAVGLDSGVVQDVGDASGPDPEMAGEFVDALPFPVELDDVVSVERFGWAGHVYNLETSGGYYVADGIITHNCRCTSVPYRPEWAAAGIDDQAWYDKHHEAAIAEALEAGEKPRRGPSPGEKWAGRTKAPVPVSP